LLGGKIEGWMERWRMGDSFKSFMRFGVAEMEDNKRVFIDSSKVFLLIYIL